MLNIPKIDFKGIVKDIFSSKLLLLGFKTYEENDSIIFSSEKVTIKFVFDPRSYETNYFLKYRTLDYDYENLFVERFLQINQPLSFKQISTEEKIRNWLEFRLNYLLKWKNDILLGNESFYSNLNSFFLSQIAEYNQNLNKKY